MSRQHTPPIVLSETGAKAAVPLSFGSGPDQVSEAQLQQLIHEFPSCLPVEEIDPLFANPVPLCMELSTNAGPIDNLLITDTGLPIIVECKLWRNPEGRREVVGQILDYAKELTRWSSSDFQREVAKRTGIADTPVLTLLRAAGREVDEVRFNDALTHNLRRGRFMLLIVGDGIREGVETISEYLQVHANLHFSLGLVEMPIFLAGDSRIVAPRVLARTHLIERHVVAVPEGFALQAPEDDAADEDDNDPTSPFNFWSAFVAGLKLDDPEQAPPKATARRSIYMPLPVPGSASLWFTIYRIASGPRVGIYLSYVRDSLGSRVVERLLDDWGELRDQLGGSVSIDDTDQYGRKLILDCTTTGNWAIPEEREKAFIWLQERVNRFVNVLRPRIKAAVADIERES